MTSRNSIIIAHSSQIQRETSEAAGPTEYMQPTEMQMTTDQYKDTSSLLRIAPSLGIYESISP